jgi:hypothetical protein
VTDVVVDFCEAKQRLRPKERVWGPPPIQATLALAEELRGRLRAGEVNQADLARLYGVSRARVTQVLLLLKLHPAILDFLRGLPPEPHARLYTERRLRPLLHLEPRGQLRRASLMLRDFAVRVRDGKRA